jgi:hypothetical protein
MKINTMSRNNRRPLLLKTWHSLGRDKLGERYNYEIYWARAGLVTKQVIFS